VLQQKDIQQVTVCNAAGAVLFSKQYNHASTVIIPGSSLTAKGILFVRINGGAAHKLILN
jgi:hypothetical protein